MPAEDTDSQLGAACSCWDFRLCVLRTGRVTGVVKTDDLVKSAMKRKPRILLATCVRPRKISRKKHDGMGPLGGQKLGGVRASESLCFGRSTQVSG